MKTAEKLMQAITIQEFGKDLVLSELPLPQPQADEILIQVKASCLCPADYKLKSGRMPLKLPHIPGHEIAGLVSSLGSNVHNCKLGDRVVIYMYQVCGRCPACRQGQENLCSHLTRLGFETSGGHAEYAIVKADQIVHLPDSISFKAAAAIPDAVCTSLHALKDKAQLGLNDTVLFYGVGGLGMQGLQIAKLCGAKIIAVARSEDKLTKAKEFGADYTLNPLKTQLPEAIQELTGGKGVDAVIDYVVNQESIDNSLQALRKGGKYILVGSSSPQVSFAVGLVMFKEISIHGSLGMTKQNMLDAVELCAKGLLRPYVTEEYQLSEINIALNRLEQGKILGRSVILF